MLVQQTLQKLEAVGLGAMATALREQLENPQYLELSFEDRLGLLVDREADWRDSRRLQTRLKAARLRHAATLEDIDFRAPRGLDRSVVLSLAQAGWVQHHQNLLITGATGCGKSYLSCALAHAAIRQGHRSAGINRHEGEDERALHRRTSDPR
jgi:DNA replication protein DnaC